MPRRVVTYSTVRTSMYITPHTLPRPTTPPTRAGKPRPDLMERKHKEEPQTYSRKAKAVSHHPFLPALLTRPRGLFPTRHPRGLLPTREPARTQASSAPLFRNPSIHFNPPIHFNPKSNPYHTLKFKSKSHYFSFSQIISSQKSHAAPPSNPPPSPTATPPAPHPPTPNTGLPSFGYRQQRAAAGRPHTAAVV